MQNQIGSLWQELGCVHFVIDFFYGAQAYDFHIENSVLSFMPLRIPFMDYLLNLTQSDTFLILFLILVFYLNIFSSVNVVF